MSSWSLTLECGPADRELLIADLWEAGTVGITEGETWLRAFFTEEAIREDILQRFAPYHPSVEEDEEHDWERGLREDIESPPWSSRSPTSRRRRRGWKELVTRSTGQTPEY